MGSSDRATECKFKNYGDIAQLGSKIKNACNGIFCRKRRSSPASKEAIAICGEPMGTSDRATECKFKNYGDIAQLGERQVRNL